MENVSKSYPVIIEFKGGTRLELEVVKESQSGSEYFFTCEDGYVLTVPKYNVLYIFKKKQKKEEENFS